jgi:hypothetical protein
MYFAGIDPGKKGGFSLFDVGEKPHLIEVLAFENNPQWRGILTEWLRKWEIHRTWIEFVHSMPAQGVKSMFSFGYSSGSVDTVLELGGVKAERIPPQHWQQVCGLNKLPRRDMTKGERYKIRKAMHKQFALERYPQITTISGDIFDAVCIGHANVTDYLFKRRMHGHD